MSDFVVVESYRWRYEAEMARGLLEDAGLSALVSADDAGGALAGLGSVLGSFPVRLLVPAEEAALAREILAPRGEP